MKSLASIVLELNKLWENTDKEVLADNIEYYLYKKFPELKSYKMKMDKLEDLCDSKRQTIYAWINRSRKRVKIPLLKLCILSENLDVDIMRFFEKNKNNK